MDRRSQSVQLPQLADSTLLFEALAGVKMCSGQRASSLLSSSRRQHEWRPRESPIWVATAKLTESAKQRRDGLLSPHDTATHVPILLFRC